MKAPLSDALASLSVGAGGMSRVKDVVSEGAKEREREKKRKIVKKDEVKRVIVVAEMEDLMVDGCLISVPHLDLGQSR